MAVSPYRDWVALRTRTSPSTCQLEPSHCHMHPGMKPLFPTVNHAWDSSDRRIGILIPTGLRGISWDILHVQPVPALGSPTLTHLMRPKSEKKRYNLFISQ